MGQATIRAGKHANFRVVCGTNLKCYESSVSELNEVI